MDAAEFRVDVRLGHELLGTAGEAYCRADLEPQPGGPVSTSRCNMYGLRHGLAHLCLAHSSSTAAVGAVAQAATAQTSDDLAVSALLDRLALNFGFWQVRFWDTCCCGLGGARLRCTSRLTFSPALTALFCVVPFS